MPPKKGKKKDKKGDGDKKSGGEKSAGDSNKVTEVDKLLYEYQLQSLDNKIQRVQEELNQTMSHRLQNEKEIGEIRKEKGRVISFLNDKLRKKTEEAADLAETLEGSKQEFDLTVRKLLTEIEEEENKHQARQNELNNEIQEYQDEIKSLIHFQEIREEIEARERQLAADVQSQRAEYTRQNELLAQRERDDLLRLKKDMIRRVNESASDFRKASDSQVAPTIKRALRENQQVKLALKKLETTRSDIDEQTLEYATKLESAILKQKSLSETEMELAHQSHAKSQIMAQLRKKIKEATAELASLEEREVEIEEKGNILNDLRDKLEDQKFEIFELQKEQDELNATLAKDRKLLSVKEAQCARLKWALGECAADLLQKNCLTRPNINLLMEVVNHHVEISDDALSAQVSAIEPIGLS